MTTDWRCESGRKVNPITKRRETICPGSLKIEKIKGIKKVTELTPHSHPALPFRTAVLEALEMTKDLARTGIKPCQVIRQVIDAQPEGIAKRLPKKGAMTKKVGRTQKKDTHPNPRTLVGLEIPDEYTKTIEGTKFLAKAIVEGDNSLFIFMSEKSLKYLRNAEFWICDGTFKTVPELFYQLYTIHALVGPGQNKHVFPLAYCLMSGKSEELYTALFKEIDLLAEESGYEIFTKLVIADFEKASMNAVRSVFGDVEVNGCYFHFRQCLMKKLNEMDLRDRYCFDLIFWLKVNQVAALAFLPPEEIPGAFAQLLSFLPRELDDFVKYMDKVWVRGEVRASSRYGGRLPVQYSPKIWSVGKRTELGIPRTQNIVESWHNRMKSIIDRNHVGFWKMIKELQSEEKAVHTNIERLFDGEKLKYIPPDLEAHEEKLKTVLANRADYDTVVDFLGALASNLTLK